MFSLTNKRQPVKVVLNFTERIFPTPMRESTKVDEDNWIAKNAMFLRKKQIRENGNTKYFI